MKGRARVRAGQAPKPTASEITAWRRLITRARAAAAKPLGDPTPFVRAADKAAKAVCPVGHQRVDSAFVQLVRLGKSWLTLTSVDRQQQAQTVADLAGRCADVLDADAPASADEPWWAK